MFIKLFLISLLLIINYFNYAFSANILFLSTVASPSHHIYNRALAFGLANKGHNVTYIGADQDKVPKPKNFTFIYLEDMYKDEGHEMPDVNEMAKFNALEMVKEFQDWCTYYCKKMAATKGFEQLLKYPTDFFDLIVIDVTAGYCFLPLIEYFKFPPTVSVTAFLLPGFMSWQFGNYFYPAEIPWYGLAYSDEMTFYERLHNYFFTYYDMLTRHFMYNDENFSFMKKRLGGAVSKTWSELEEHIALLLANTDPVLDFAQPLTPNIIGIGGLHVRKPKKIPQEFEELLNNSKHGVIIFSLGTNVRSDKLSDSQKTGLLSAFSRLQETIIWKFESDFDNLPKNVIIKKWLPQNDILSHPNVKLFIGHGGALSTQEAIYHGVPIIGIPFIVDQHINTKLLVKKQLGVYINAEEISEHYVYSSIREVLDNPIYRKNMKEASATYNDRLETPLERAVFWTEYVLRHRGAKLLNPRGRKLPFYIRLGLDVALFAVSVISAIIFMVLFVIRKCLFCSSGKQKIKIS